MQFKAQGGLAGSLRGTPSTNESTGFCTDESWKADSQSFSRLSAEIRFAKTSSGLLGRNRCSKGVATISRRIRRSMPRRLKTGIWLMAWVLLDAIGGINCVFCGIKGLAENMSMHQPGARHGIWHVPSITQAVREFYCASPVCSD